MRRKKIVWIPIAPADLYEPVFNKLAKQKPGWELVMVCVDFPRRCREPKFFRAEYLAVVENGKKGKVPNITATTDLEGLDELLVREKPDIVISNVEYTKFTLTAAKYCQRTNTPFIVQSETKRIKPLWKFIAYLLAMRVFRRCVFRCANKVTCWSKEAVSFARRIFPVADKSSIVLFQTPVEVERFYPARRGKHEKQLRIIFPARFIGYKRHADLVQAVNILREKHNLDVAVSFIGSGGTEAEIRSLVKREGLEKSFTFLPKVPYEEMRLVYANHDLLVLPSYNEAIGLVVPEAMACGIPTIVSDTSGAKDYLQDGVHGYVFRTFDCEDLAEKILLLKDYRKRSEMGKKAADYVRKNFNAQAAARRFGKIIEENI